MHSAVDEILVADLSTAAPRSALAERPRRGKWWMLPYQTAAGNGVLLRSFPEAPAPRVRIPLSTTGQFAVHLGIHYSTTERDDLAVRFGAATEFGRLHVRMKGDPAFDLVLPEVMGRKGEPDPAREVHDSAIIEVFWRYAELDGPTYVEIEPGVASIEPCAGNPACLAWIRLVPLSPERARLTERLRPTPDTRRLTAVGGVGRPEDIAALAHVLATSDIDRFYFDSMRIDACCFPTGRGAVYGSFDYECGNYSVEAARAVRRTVDRGIDPLHEVVAAGREHGVDVYAAMRITLHRDPPQHLPLALPSFMAEHPEYWVKDRHGDRYQHAALAEPPVRRRIIEMFEEVVSTRDVAGVCILGLRGWPWVGYEPASARLFEEGFGTPLREVDESDPRFVEHRCRIFTTFMRELRTTMDAAGRRRGRPVRVAFDAMNSLPNCRYHGQDVVEWARNGLIDELTLDACHDPSRPDPDAHPTPAATRAVVDAVGDPGFSVRPHLWPRFMAPARFMERAGEFWEAGVSGLALWDLYHRVPRLSEWAVQRHLGHRGQYDALRDEAAHYWRSVPIHSMAGICMRNRAYAASSG